MNCTEFVKGFTDYFDGSTDPLDLRAMDEHLVDCASCRRYKLVYERGASLLRSLPEPEIPEDFQPRLQHRIFHLTYGRPPIDASASATPALTVLGLAILLTAVAWSPLLRAQAPVVDLDPIVVYRAPRVAFVPPATWTVSFASASAPATLDGDLWGSALLYEYSPLFQRYRRNGALWRVGLGSGR